MKSPRAKFQVFWLKNDVMSFSVSRYVGILTFRHCDVKMTSYMKMSLNSEPKNSPLCQS